MAGTINLDPGKRSTASSDPRAEAGTLLVYPTFVASIPTAQRYYWTDAWQSGERETLVALEAGQGIRFTSGEKLFAWLLAEDDDDDAASGH